jgi:hypothetical protein
MSAAQKWISCGGMLAILLEVFFPPWQQPYQGHRLPYRVELGHHFLQPPPQPTGEQSWIQNVPASECTVSVESMVVLRQCGMVLAMTAILLIGFRQATGSSVGNPLNMRRLGLVSLLLALCLPVPPPDGIPVAALVIMSPLALFSDGGHLGRWFVPMLAVASFGTYFAITFLVLWAVAWVFRRSYAVAV